MLVLSRKKNESLVIDGGRIVIEVVEIRGDKVRLGIEAPPEISVHRREVQDAINRETSRAKEKSNAESSQENKQSRGSD